MPALFVGFMGGGVYVGAFTLISKDACGGQDEFFFSQNTQRFGKMKNISENLTGFTWANSFDCFGLNRRGH